MTVTLNNCVELPLSSAEIDLLGKLVYSIRDLPEEAVAIQCVPTDEIQRLNRQYRHKDKPTNILTFSYPPVNLPVTESVQSEHEIFICLEVARQEAGRRQIPLRDYCALLITHALLHASGLDHEASDEEAHQMNALEKDVLQQAGFTPIFL